MYTFAQLFAARCQDQRKVSKTRFCRAERLIDQDLLVRVCEMILTANNVCYPHLDVIADNGEIVERMAIRAEQHEVLGLFIFTLLETKNAVLERCLAGLWNL